MTENSSVLCNAGKEEHMNAGEAMRQGKAYLENGEYELAAEAFTEAILLDPQNAGAYNSRGNAYSKLNNARVKVNFDTSVGCQEQVLDILNEDIQKIESVCRKYKQPVPKLMKFTYEPKTKKFNAEYTYENQTSDDVSVFDNYDAWFEEEQRRLEKMQSR